MRLIDADAFKAQVSAVTALQGLNVEKAALLLRLIDQQPTIDAEPVVHARWMHDPADIANFYAGDCSNCGCAPKRRSMSFKPWDYCPNCGARMDADAPERAGKERE
jgi:hypothetical protein